MNNDNVLIALSLLKENMPIKVQLGCGVVVVDPCPITGATVESKSSRSRGIILGQRRGFKGNRRYAYIGVFGGQVCNVSRAAVRII